MVAHKHNIHVLLYSFMAALRMVSYCVKVSELQKRNIAEYVSFCIPILFAANCVKDVYSGM
jgi:hypothetical protein